MSQWREVRENGLNSLTWWELIIKPGIQSLEIQRSKELNEEERGEMNLLLIQQAHLVKKLQKHQSDYHYLGQLHKVQNQIREWYKRRSQKIKVQSRRKEFQDTESTRIYHHDLHKSFIKKSSILKLETDDGSIIEGHENCALYLSN